jgi:hypothetical protein
VLKLHLLHVKMPVDIIAENPPSYCQPCGKKC